MKTEEGSPVWSQNSPSPPGPSWRDDTCTETLPGTLCEPCLAETLSTQSLYVLSVVKGLHYENEVSHLTKQAHDRDTGSSEGWRQGHREFGGVALARSAEKCSERADLLQVRAPGLGRWGQGSGG